MEKNQLTKQIFDVLYQSNLVFTEEELKNKLNLMLKGSKLAMHEKSTPELVKQLILKGYLNQEDNYLVKTARLMKNEKNKQYNLLLDLIHDYATDFDVDYIKNEYLKGIKLREFTPANLDYIIEYSYDIIKHDMLSKKIASINYSKNQFEL